MIMNCAKTAEILPSIDEILNKADDVCPVQWAVNVAETAMKNTCGKGTFCRDGLKQLYLIGKDITLDKGTMEDIELLQELCQTMYIAADCELSGRCVELYRDLSGDLLQRLDRPCAAPPLQGRGLCQHEEGRRGRRLRRHPDQHSHRLRRGV